MRNVCVIKVTPCLLAYTEALVYVFGRRQTACCNVFEGNTITLLLCSLNMYLLFAFSNSNETGHIKAVLL